MRRLFGARSEEESAPPGLRDRFGLRGRLYEATRDAARTIEHLDPWFVLLRDGVLWLSQLQIKLLPV